MCGSTHAGADDARSIYDFTHMQCHACGHGALVDHARLKARWMLEVELDGKRFPSRVAPLQSAPDDTTERLGCERCAGADASSAWLAMQTRHVKSLVQESHFGVHLAQCGCGQSFVEVFTERIDWKDGEDAQDWLVLPLHSDEVEALIACGEEGLEAMITELGRTRRFLVRTFPTGGAAKARWRQGGLAIGPHD